MGKFMLARTTSAEYVVNGDHVVSTIWDYKDRAEHLFDTVSSTYSSPWPSFA